MSEMIDRIVAHEVRIRGAGSPVVLSHGLGGSQDQWTGVVDALARTHRVLTFTLAGSPGADPAVFSTVRHSTVFGYADDLIDLVTQAGFRGATYIGHSTAGMAGALASAVDPGIFTRIAVIGSSPRYLDDPETGYVGGFDRPSVDGILDAIERDFAGWASSFSGLMMGVQDRPELVDAFRRHLLAYDREVAHWAFRSVLTSDLRRYMPRIGVPTLVVAGTADPVAPWAVTEWLARTLPDARIATIETAGHLPQFTAPEQLIAALEPFLTDAV